MYPCLGFQSEDVVFYEEKFHALGETHIVTVDGAVGQQDLSRMLWRHLVIDFATYL